MVYALRGAVSVSEDTEEAMNDAVVTLFQTLLEENNVKKRNIISVIFSVTPDLTSLNPAAGLRRAGVDSLPLFCTQEPVYEGSHPRIVRILLICRKWCKLRPLKPVYIRGAEKLRPDLFTTSR